MKDNQDSEDEDGIPRTGDMSQKREKKRLIDVDEDNDLYRYSNFIPPGKHYFYFIKNNQYYFLSPRYEIVRFKGTHLFLNQMIIQPRQE